MFLRTEVTNFAKALLYRRNSVIVESSSGKTLRKVLHVIRVHVVWRQIRHVMSEMDESRTFNPRFAATHRLDMSVLVKLRIGYTPVFQCSWTS